MTSLDQSSCLSNSSGHVLPGDVYVGVYITQFPSATLGNLEHLLASISTLVNGKEMVLPPEACSELIKNPWAAPLPRKQLLIIVMDGDEGDGP